MRCAAGSSLGVEASFRRSCPLGRAPLMQAAHVASGRCITGAAVCGESRRAGLKKDAENILNFEASVPASGRENVEQVPGKMFATKHR